MKDGLVVFWTVLAALVVIPGGVFAEGTEETREEVTLQTVVVTATRIEEEVARVPASVTVIDEEDIKNSNANSVVHLLRSQEGIVVRDVLGNGKTAQVDMRGYGETGPYNTLVLVDGRRVNEIDLSGVDWTQIPVEQVARVEIVRGTGTVLYGDNAVGGVINIITKVPSDKVVVSSGISGGSYDSHKEELSISGGKDKVAASLLLRYDTTDGYRKNNDFQARDASGKIVFYPTEFLTFNLSGSYHDDDYGLPSTLTKSEMNKDRQASTRPHDNAETTDKYAHLTCDLDLGHYGTFITDFSYRDRESEEDFASFTFTSDRNTDTWALTPRYAWDGQIFNRENTLIVGTDFYWADQDVKSFFGAPLAPSSRSDVGRDTIGFYLNNELFLLDNLMLTLGARRERAKYDLKQKDRAYGLADLDDRVTDWETAYTGGLTFLYGNKSSLFLRANRSFRFPLVDELVVYDFNAGQILVNPDIKTQKGDHYEAGLKHFFAPDISANVTLFRVKTDDEIFFNPRTFSNTNHPGTLRRGVEIGSRADLFGSVLVYGNYTYLKATFDDDPFKNKDVPAVPRHAAHFGFSIHDVIPGVIFSADYNYVGSSYPISDQANEFEKLDDYYRVDARLSYEWKFLQAFVGVNNLTDQEYEEYAATGGYPPDVEYFPAPERNWLGGIKFVFSEW